MINLIERRRCLLHNYSCILENIGDNDDHKKFKLTCNHQLINTNIVPNQRLVKLLQIKRYINMFICGYDLCRLGHNTLYKKKLNSVLKDRNSYLSILENIVRLFLKWKKLLSYRESIKFSMRYNMSLIFYDYTISQ